MSKQPGAISYKKRAQIAQDKALLEYNKTFSGEWFVIIGLKEEKLRNAKLKIKGTAMTFHYEKRVYKSDLLEETTDLSKNKKSFYCQLSANKQSKYLEMSGTHYQSVGGGFGSEAKYHLSGFVTAWEHISDPLPVSKILFQTWWHARRNPFVQDKLYESLEYRYQIYSFRRQKEMPDYSTF